MQEVIERATKQVVTSSSEIILSKFQEVQELISRQQIYINTVASNSGNSQQTADHEERIK